MANSQKAGVRLSAISESMNQYTNSKYQFTFGTTVTNLTAESLSLLAKKYADVTFGEDIQKAKAESGMSSDAGINASVKEGLLGRLKAEYTARVDNSFNKKYKEQAFAESHVGTYQSTLFSSGGTLRPMDQLGAVALVQAVIQPVYNKIMKTFVETAPNHIRQFDKPTFLTADGQVLGFFDTINDSDKLDALFSGSNLKCELPVKIPAGGYNKNIIDEYSTLMGKPIGTSKNFINRGVKVTKVKISGVEYGIDVTSTGNSTQSGQDTSTIATLNFKVTDKSHPSAPAIKVAGTVTADGVTFIAASDPALTELTLEFVLPPIDQQGGFTIAPKANFYQIPLDRYARGNFTLNEQLLADYKAILQKDGVEQFTSTIVTTVNAKKDNDALKRMQEMVEFGKAQAALTGSIYENPENMSSSLTSFGSSEFDANVADLGFVNTYQKYNLGLAQQLMTEANKMDVAFNPSKREFSIVTSSLGVQRVNTAGNTIATELSMTGNIVEDGIAGIGTSAYTLNRVKIGENYVGYIVGSNRGIIASKDVSVTTPAGAKKVKEHTYWMKPDFEETQDTMAFINGAEYFTEGTGNAAMPNSKTINYETRYGIATYSQTIAEVTLKEMPVS